MFIGDVRRKLFIPVDHEWNGVVRDITAKLETEGMEVDSLAVEQELAKVYRSRASVGNLALLLQAFEGDTREPS